MLAKCGFLSLFLMLLIRSFASFLNARMMAFGGWLYLHGTRFTSHIRMNGLVYRS